MSLIVSNEHEMIEADTTTAGSMHKRLGKLEAKGHPNQLMLASYIPKGKAAVVVPDTYSFWKKKKAFGFHDTGNNEMGNCTRASQGILAERFERLEQRRTIAVSKEELVRVYVEMSDRLYGGGDNGAYEMDAMNCWRNPDYTFRDYKGRPLTIDAYVRVNHFDINEIKRALFLSAGKGIKICFSMPLAWANAENRLWDIPEGQRTTGKWQVGSWGGHSCMALAEWTPQGIVVPSTWNEPDYLVTWRAIATYASECYLPIDSVNQWKKRLAKSEFHLEALKSDVNSVSDFKIK